MASTIGSIQASGLLVRARQVCAAPQTRPMRMAVGRWHEADVPVVVKGTRPPMKVGGYGLLTYLQSFPVCHSTVCNANTCCVGSAALCSLAWENLYGSQLRDCPGSAL